MSMRFMRDDGSYALCLTPTTEIDVKVLAAAAEETYTFPTGYTRFIFSANALYYRRLNGTASIPAADITDGTGSLPRTGEIISMPNVAGQTISLISPSACIIGIEKHQA